jgi:hypothetical protein
MNNKRIISLLLKIVLLSYLCFGLFVFNEVLLTNKDITLPSWGRFIMTFFILIIPIVSLITSIYSLFKVKFKTLRIVEKITIFLPWVYVLLILIYTIWGLNQDYPR